jgi:hypothetical protein
MRLVQRGPSSLMSASVRALPVALLALSAPALAADHAEAPGAAADPAADIADFYAWADGGQLHAIITYAGAGSVSSTALYDADVLYGIHVDTNLDGVAEHDIWLKLGQNAAGDWGVQATMGETEVSGAVDTENGDSTLKVWAGLCDDPFFFDLTGFQDTLATGTVSFTANDTFAGLNAMGLAVSADLATLGATGQFQVWTTTGRL